MGADRVAELLAYLRTPGVLGRIELADRLEAVMLQEGLRTAAQARERSDLRIEDTAPRQRITCAARAGNSDVPEDIVADDAAAMPRN